MYNYFSCNSFHSFDIYVIFGFINYLFFSGKRCDAICVMLNNYFTQTSNPYEHTLLLIYLSPDYYQAKSSGLAFTGNNNMSLKLYVYV